MSGKLEQLILALPHPFREAAANIKSWHLDRLRRGGDWSSFLEENNFQRYFSMSWEETLSNQEERLLQLVQHARVHVPHYHNYPPLTCIEDLRDYPLLTKTQARTAGERLYDRALLTRPHYTGHTSGSTGTPFTFKWTLETLRSRFAIRDNYYALHGYHSERELNIRFGGRLFKSVAQKTPPFWISDRITKQLLFSLYHMSDLSLRSFLPIVERLQPMFITGYPSAIHTFAQFCAREGTDYRPRAVFTDSETVLEYQREAIRNVWNCEVYDYYGMEAGWLAGQCSSGRYHISPLTSVVEVVDENAQPQLPGKLGELVVTDLINPLMPLIRYQTGDLAIWSSENCSCGWNTPSLERIEGRLDDIVTLPDGRLIGRLDHIFKTTTNIRECQIIQETPSEFTFLVVPDDGYSDAVEYKLLEEAYKRLGHGITINISKVDTIRYTSGRKFRSVISKVKVER